MNKKSSDTQTGPTPSTASSASASGGASFGHNPLAGRAHIINRGELQDEASSGPGSLDPKTLAAPKVPEARRWLAKRGIDLEIPANWKYLGIGADSRSLTFISDTQTPAHAIEIHLSPMPDELTPEQFITSQEEQLQEATELKRVVSWSRRTLGQVDGLLVLGWGPDTRDALSQASDEDLYLATDGTGRRALSWRGIVERASEKGKERVLVIVALSSPIELFPDAKRVYDALLDACAVYA